MEDVAINVWQQVPYGISNSVTTDATEYARARVGNRHARFTRNSLTHNREDGTPHSHLVVAKGARRARFEKMATKAEKMKKQLSALHGRVNVVNNAARPRYFQ